jgi:hypothetical protein
VSVAQSWLMREVVDLRGAAASASESSSSSKLDPSDSSYLCGWCQCWILLSHVGEHADCISRGLALCEKNTTGLRHAIEVAVCESRTFIR